MFINVQTYSIEDNANLQTGLSIKIIKYKNLLERLEKENTFFSKQLDRKTEECKYNKISYEYAYKDMEKQNDLMKTQLEELKGKNVDTNFRKPSTMGTSQVSKMFKQHQTLKSRFAPQVVEKNDLTKSVTSQSIPQKEKENVVVKNTYVIAPSLSRISSKTMSKSTSKESYGTNDMCKKYKQDGSRKNAKGNTVNSNLSVLILQE